VVKEYAGGGQTGKLEILVESERDRAAMILRTLIVDDEQIARRVLREELESIGGVEIVGEGESGAVAFDEIAGRHPALVLLDLQMPAMSALEVVSRMKCGEYMPVIVIVTVYDQYAKQAFDGARSTICSNPFAGSAWQRPSNACGLLPR